MVLVALIAALLVFALTHFAPLPGTLHDVMSRNGGREILDLQPAFSADGVYERLSSFGQAGRVAYFRMLLGMDLLFPTTFTTFLLVLGRYAAGRTGLSSAPRLLLLALPLGYFIPDLAENFSIAWLIHDYPDRHDGLAGALGYLTVAKRLFMYAALLMPVGLLVIDMVGRQKRREGRQD